MTEEVKKLLRELPQIDNDAASSEFKSVIMDNGKNMFDLGNAKLLDYLGNFNTDKQPLIGGRVKFKSGHVSIVGGQGFIVICRGYGGYQGWCSGDLCDNSWCSADSVTKSLYQTWDEMLLPLALYLPVYIPAKIWLEGDNVKMEYYVKDSKRQKTHDITINPVGNTPENEMVEVTRIIGEMAKAIGDENVPSFNTKDESEDFFIPLRRPPTIEEVVELLLEVPQIQKAPGELKSVMLFKNASTSFLNLNQARLLDNSGKEFGGSNVFKNGYFVGGNLLNGTLPWIGGKTTGWALSRTGPASTVGEWIGRAPGDLDQWKDKDGWVSTGTEKNYIPARIWLEGDNVKMELYKKGLPRLLLFPIHVPDTGDPILDKMTALTLIIGEMVTNLGGDDVHSFNTKDKSEDFILSKEPATIEEVVELLLEVPQIQKAPGELKSVTIFTDTNTSLLNLNQAGLLDNSGEEFGGSNVFKNGYFVGGTTAQGEWIGGATTGWYEGNWIDPGLGVVNQWKNKDGYDLKSTKAKFIPASIYLENQDLVVKVYKKGNDLPSILVFPIDITNITKSTKDIMSFISQIIGDIVYVLNDDSIIHFNNQESCTEFINNMKSKPKPKSKTLMGIKIFLFIIGVVLVSFLLYRRSKKKVGRRPRIMNRNIVNDRPPPPWSLA